MKVSVIIANRNDTAMLAVTIRSALEEVKPVGGEVVVVDNSDREIWDAIKDGQLVSSKYNNVRFYRQEFPCLFSARDKAVGKSRGHYIVCLDSHMIVGRDMIKDLVEFMDKSPETVGFAHAPVNWIYQHPSAAKHDRNMDLVAIGNGDRGSWQLQYDHERKISWKGMPWICRRRWYLTELGGYGALAEYQLSWPGDPHIGIKPWLLGFENWAVPTSPGIHIGPWKGKLNKMHRYRLYNSTGTHNEVMSSMVSTYVLGGEESLRKYGWIMLRKMRGSPEKCKNWFDERMESYLPDVKRMGDREKKWLDERRVMTFEEMLEKQPWNSDQKLNGVST